MQKPLPLARLISLFLGLTFSFSAFSQAIPSPESHFGHPIGTDYQLVNYTQAEAYFHKVAAVSDRAIIQEIGTTEEGRNQYVMILSSAENLQNLEHYKRISQRLARAEDLSEQEARELARQGKAVVWIDGGLHATETVGSHQLLELSYQLTSRQDEETMRILDDVIILLSQVNPDGQELVADWYMQQEVPEKRNMRIPRLYQKYIGHDNNRDFYMMNMKETTHIAAQQYIEWMPQIIYNHHQSAPAGAVVAGPPYRDPFNFVYDPLLITGIDGVGAAMINRLITEGKPGYTRLKGSVYSTWWNGGLRTTPYFHNMIGLLTEITGNPTPGEIPLVPERLIPDNATPFPVRPQPWSFRQSIDYSVSLNYAVLDYAGRNRDHVLFSIYSMGKNAIDKGSEDSWSLQPKHIDLLRPAYQADLSKQAAQLSRGSSGTLPLEYYSRVYEDPAKRDPRGFIIPSGQRDFPTAVKFVNALIKSGIRVEKALADFSVLGKAYPKGSYIVKTNQAFRPHVLDMFEPQDHPNDFLYPGGPPVRPYDAAGWTLAFQMGVDFDRILEGFDGPFQTLPYGELQPMPPVVNASSASGFVLDPASNNTFIAVNELLAAGLPVYRTLQESSPERPAGSFLVPEEGFALLKEMGERFGVRAVAAGALAGAKAEIKPLRIAIVDQYGGSMPAGWLRWIMEQFHYPFEVIYPKRIDSGELNRDFDLLIFMGSAIPLPGQSPRGPRMPDPEDIPEEYRSWLGSITQEHSIPQLQAFMQNGGRVVTVGQATNLAYHLSIGVQDALMKTGADGQTTALTDMDYYIPGSLLRASLDRGQMAAWGMNEQADFLFNRSPVFTFTQQARDAGVREIAWFDARPLRSGWAWGQQHLEGGVAAFTAPIGKGSFYAFGPEITFRAQSHGTFKLLFNTLYGMEPSALEQLGGENVR